jgi:hypothetical protein
MDSYRILSKRQWFPHINKTVYVLPIVTAIGYKSQGFI